MSAELAEFVARRMRHSMTVGSPTFLGLHTSRVNLNGMNGEPTSGFHKKQRIKCAIF